MSSARILFVEDNVICQLETSDALRRQGFEVVEAANAVEALGIIKGSGALDALVTDIDLGPGGDGYEVARLGRATFPHLAVVYISDSAGARHRAEGVTGSAFVAKPFHTRDLAEALDRAIYVQAA